MYEIYFGVWKVGTICLEEEGLRTGRAEWGLERFPALRRMEFNVKPG